MNPFIYQAKIQYCGANYYGMQWQKNHPTIAGELIKALEKLSPGHQKVIAASRTDRRVHALDQLIRLEIERSIPAENLQRALNQILPNDIYVKSVAEAESSFHPIKESKSKEYIYLFQLGRSGLNPFYSPYMHWVDEQIDLDLAQSIAQKLVGVHDFQNFYCTGSEVHSTVREIFSFELLNFQQLRDYNLPFIHKRTYGFKIHGSGFLKQMVRLLVGAVWAAGLGKIKPTSIEAYLDQKRDDKLSPTIPGNGLYLVKTFLGPHV